RHVGKDLVGVAYRVAPRPGSIGDRDLGLAAATALLSAGISRNLLGTASAVELRGTVGGDARLYLGEATGQTGQLANGAPEVVMPTLQPGLKLTDSARIKGTLTYTSNQQYPLAGQVGTTVWNPLKVSPREP